MVRHSLIVFDWDQTLWNSWDLHLQGLWYAADRLGLPRPSASVIAGCYSVPLDEHVRGLFQQDREKVTALYIESYHLRVKELAHLYDGVVEVLAALRRDGYSLAVFSDKRTAYGHSEVELAGIAPLFDFVLFRRDGRAYKPDPEGLRQVLESLSVPEEQALVVGDSHVDMACAHSAGVASAAALWGSVDRQATLDQGPDYAWHTLGEMEAALI